MKHLEKIREKLKDERSMEIIFLSHCLLNTNTRYFGGAFRRSSVNEVVAEAIENGYGIVQIECPEKRAWGGVLKNLMWIPFDAKHSFIYRFKRLLLPLFICYTRLVYRRIAVSLVKDIQGYIKAGFTVRGITGIDGSPTCGVNMRLSMDKCFEFYALSRTEDLNRDTFNKELYETCSEAGGGMFIEILKKLLDKKHIEIPIYAHSLVSEMRGESSGIRRN